VIVLVLNIGISSFIGMLLKPRLSLTLLMYVTSKTTCLMRLTVCFKVFLLDDGDNYCPGGGVL